MDEYIYSQSIHKDFHGVMSYLIKFIRESHSQKHMEEFFSQAASYNYKPLIDRIKKNGLIEMKKHLERVFSMENGEFELEFENSKLAFEVRKCPAIWYMKDNDQEVDKDFCRCSTELVNQSIARECGYNFSVKYDQDKGQCVQKFWEAG